MWVLKVLGGASLQHADGGKPVLLQRRPLALLALLAIAGERGISRERLAGFLWPESGEEQSRGALRQVLHLLRRSLGSPDPIMSGVELRLDSKVVASDVEEFERLLAAGFVERAMACYGGPFLDGFHLAGAGDFERWTATERERLSRQYEQGCEQLAGAAEAEGNAAAAAEWWRRVIALDPLSSRAALGYMRALATAGDSGAALRHARVYAAVVREELDLEPDPIVTAYADALRACANTTAKVSTAIVASVPPAAPDPPDSTNGPAAESVTPQPPATSDIESNSPLQTERPPLALAPVRRRYYGRLIAASCVAVACGLVGASRVAHRHYVAPMNAKRVLFSGFDNRTGDTTFSALGRITDDWLVTTLTRVGGFDIVDGRVGVHQPSSATARIERSTHADRLKLAEEVRAGTLIEGSYFRERDGLWFQVQITDANTGKLLRGDDPVIAPVAHPMEAVKVLGDRVPALLAMVISGPFSSSSTSSSAPPTYESYAEYLAGTEHMWRGEYPEAIGDFTRSAAHDSTFTLPLVLTAFVYWEMGRCEQTDSIARLLKLRNTHLASFDRVMLERQVARCHGNWTEALQLARESLELAPKSVIAASIVVDAALDAHRPRDGLAIFDRFRLDTVSEAEVNATWQNVLFSLHLLGEYERELIDARRARARASENIYLMQYEAEALAAEGNTGELRALIDHSLVAPPLPLENPGSLMQIAGAELRVHGYLPQADSIEALSIAWYKRLPHDEAASEKNRAGLALVLAEAGHLPEAVALYDTLIVDHPDSVGYHGAVGVLAARQGNRVRSEREDAWLASLHSPYLLGANTLWRARIAARLRDRERALDLLRRAISEGQRIAHDMHQIVDWEPLRNDSRFQEIMRPE
jgi:DNA-binding SARP family transcriptional activator/tetratricopeptide (TPR) repeat protein